ncbi:alpha/beta hydrolase [Planctomycetota bacterium]
MATLLLSIFAVFFIAYVILALGLYFMQSHFVYSPVRQVEYTPGDLGLDFEDVNFEAEDGMKLNGWYIPSAGSKFTVLFCHGNGGNIMHRLDSINIFYELGLSCFIFDYRGYGRSEGRASETGTYLDAMAAYKWLRELKKVPPSDIIILGKSLGGSIAAELAGKVDAAGLVLESVFTSYVDIGRKFYPYMPVRWFAKYSYRTIDYVKKVEFPVMIIHSRNDELVPFEFGVELFEAANEPKEFVEISGSHNDGFLLSSEIYKSTWVRWVKFLTEYESKVDSRDAS